MRPDCNQVEAHGISMCMEVLDMRSIVLICVHGNTALLFFALERSSVPSVAGERSAWILLL